MDLFKYSAITALIALLTGCSSVPATDSSIPVPTDVSNADIQCIQEGLNKLDREVESIDFNVGDENGVMNQNAEEALVRFENMVQGKLPVLTDQSAAGHCDVLLHQAFILFELGISGEPGAYLTFALFSTDNVSSDTEPVAYLPLVSGATHRVFIGEKLMQQVSMYCVYAQGGYGFTDPYGEIYAGACQPAGQDLKTAGTNVRYEANLVKCKQGPSQKC